VGGLTQTRAQRGSSIGGESNIGPGLSPPRSVVTAAAKPPQFLRLGLYAIAGMVVLCGYHSALYDQLYGDWLYLEHTARQQSHAVATEVLWLNAAAARAGRQTLFAHAECHDAAVAVEEDAG